MQYPTNFDLYQTALRLRCERPDCEVTAMLYEAASRLMDASRSCTLSASDLDTRRTDDDPKESKDGERPKVGGSESRKGVQFNTCGEGS